MRFTNDPNTGQKGERDADLFLTLLVLFSTPAVAMAAPAGSGAMATLLAMDLEELVNLEVTVATATPKPLQTVPAVVTVITAADIEAVGATTLDEALETVPGLYVMPSQTNAFSSVWSLRGIHTAMNPHVLLLVNGLWEENCRFHFDQKTRSGRHPSWLSGRQIRKYGHRASPPPGPAPPAGQPPAVIP